MNSACTGVQFDNRIAEYIDRLNALMPTHQVSQELLESISSPTSYWIPSMEQAITTGDFTSTIKRINSHIKL